MEELEQRKDAQLARSIILGLPHELNHEERVELLRSFVTNNFVSIGMIADIAIHKPDLKKGADHRNHHAHILLTLRQADKNGLYRTKTRNWNAKALTNSWRAAWASEQTQAFDRKGLVKQIDKRTLKPRPHRERTKLIFPKNFDIQLLPEVKLGKGGKKPSSKQWKQNDKILASNISKVASYRRKYRKRQIQIDKIKDRLKRRIVQLRQYPGSDSLLSPRKYSDRRNLFHLEKRMRFIVSYADMVFQMLIYIYGLETALRLRREQLQKKARKKQRKRQTAWERERERIKMK